MRCCAVAVVDRPDVSPDVSCAQQGRTGNQPGSTTNEFSTCAMAVGTAARPTLARRKLHWSTRSCVHASSSVLVCSGVARFWMYGP